VDWLQVSHLSQRDDTTLAPPALSEEAPGTPLRPPPPIEGL
jgi:hypothetical protein